MVTLGIASTKTNMIQISENTHCKRVSRVRVQKAADLISKTCINESRTHAA